MSSQYWLLGGLGCIAASFGVQSLAVPFLSGGIACGVVAEQKRRHEVQYAIPLQKMRYATWIDQEEQAIGYAAMQADYALEVQHDQLMGVNSALLLTTLEQKVKEQDQEENLRQKRQPDLQVGVPDKEEEEEEEEIYYPTPMNPSYSPEAKLLTLKDPWQQSVPFPVEDIAALMASNTLDRDNCSSLLIACPKGTGKSNLLRAAQYQLWQQSEGTATFTIFNGKEDRKNGRITSTFCGLEQDSRAYINAGDANKIDEVQSRLGGITQAMESNHERPMVQILDEYNNILIAAQIYSSILKDEQAELLPKERSPVPNFVEKIALSTVLRITKGRSKLVSDWITSHSPLVQDIGLNTKLQQSLTFIVLGRGDKLDAIHSALSGSQPVVKNPNLRNELYTAFLQWEQSNTDPYQVVCLTNLAGKWRLCTLPKYPDTQPDIRDEVAAIAVEQDTEADLWQASGLSNVEIQAVRRLQTK